MENNKYYIFKTSENDYSLYSDDSSGTFNIDDNYIVYKYTTGSGTTTTLEVPTSETSIYQSNILLTYDSTTDETGGYYKVVSKTGYYVNPDESSKTQNPLIHCEIGTEEPTTATLSPVPSTNISTEGYYVDGNNYTDGDKYTKLISCSSSSDCSYSGENSPAEGVYVDASSKTNDNKYTKLIICATPTEGGSSIQCESKAASKGYYINGKDNDNNKKIIVCEDSSCELKEASSDLDGYYIDENSKKEDNKYSKLIVCSTTTDGSNSNSTCQSKDNIDDGYYGDSSTLVNDEYKKLIICSTTSEVKTCSTNSMDAGYYINKGVSNSLEGAIFNCSSSDENDKKCKKETPEAASYYINKGSDSTDDTTPKTLIKCETGTGCTTDVGEEGYYVNSSVKESLTNGLIHCSKESGESTKINCIPDSGGNGQYYMNNGSDKTSKPLIICNETKCETSAGEVGYFLDQGKLNDDNKYLQLIYCEGETNCSSNSPSAGFYINQGKKIEEGQMIYYSGLIKCTSSTNARKRENTPTVACESFNTITSTTYFINQGIMGSNNKSKELITCEVTTETENSIKCSSATPSEEYYLNGNVGTDDSKAFIYCSKSDNNDNSNEITCEEKDGENGQYYVSATDRSLFKCTEESGNNKSCTKEESINTIGYYIDGGSKNGETQDNTPAKYTKLIHCEYENNSSTTPTCSTSGKSAGYYIDASNGSNIISCTTASELTTCSSSEHSASDTQKHYLDAVSKRVITCIDSKCYLEDKTLKGYFINDGNGESSTNYLIKCPGDNDENCSEVGASGESSAVGSIKVENETPTISICVITGCSSEQDSSDYEAIPADTNNKYLKITKAATNDFPGVTLESGESTKDISIKIGKDGYVILLENASLPECNASIPSSNVCFTGALNEQYCIHSDQSIYKTIIGEENTKSCTKITLSNTSEIFYFDMEGKKLESGEPSATTSDIMAYECSSSSQGGISCELLHGYVSITESNAIYCSGWKREGCVVETISACDSAEEGQLVTSSENSSKLCFASEITRDFTSSTTDYYAFLTTKVNPIYGQGEGEIVFLKSTASSVLVTDASGKFMFI